MPLFLFFCDYFLWQMASRLKWDHGGIRPLNGQMLSDLNTLLAFHHQKEICKSGHKSLDAQHLLTV